MNLHEIPMRLRQPAASKILMVVVDGLGGLPLTPDGPTELEAAATPHLDAAAGEGQGGMSIPVLPGLTPDCATGHLALFGYDPLQYPVSRGLSEALGLDFPLQPGDIAARGNFCTINADGHIIDRRGGHPSTERCVTLCQKLRAIDIPGLQLFVEPIREHRFLLVLRGEGLGDGVNHTDPLHIDTPPLPAVGADEPSRRTAEAVTAFVEQAAQVLSTEAPTNMVTLRGLSRYPQLPSLGDLYGLRAVALAVYPLYKGIARLAGMDVPDAGNSLGEQIDALEKLWEKYDFFYLHYPYADSAGRDGNFEGKVQMLERLDMQIPRLRALQPDVFIVTGDHSTPAKLKSRSWHSVPTILVSGNCRTDGLQAFSEAACRYGGMGLFTAKTLMTVALAHAGRLQKYGG
jgi:2,3-bisphosphoglycerate-independent phosphoglycerate mutase